jgi:hypothetical protein
MRRAIYVIAPFDLGWAPPGVGHHARGGRHSVLSRERPSCRERRIISARVPVPYLRIKIAVVCPNPDSWRAKFCIGPDRCLDASHSPGSLPNAMLLARGALIASRRCPKSQTR